MSQHIVVIEDDRSLSEVISVMLTARGYQVTCFSAYTDKDELAGSDADLFIIDERLPAVSGHIICIMLRSNPATRRVPQILMSASPMLDKFADLGEVNACIKKPFDIEELLGTVQNLLDQAVPTKKPS